MKYDPDIGIFGMDIAIVLEGSEDTEYQKKNKSKAHTQ